MYTSMWSKLASVPEPAANNAPLVAGSTNNTVPGAPPQGASRPCRIRSRVQTSAVSGPAPATTPIKLWAFFPTPEGHLHLRPVLALYPTTLSSLVSSFNIILLFFLVLVHLLNQHHDCAPASSVNRTVPVEWSGEACFSAPSVLESRAISLAPFATCATHTHHRSIEPCLCGSAESFFPSVSASSALEGH